MELLPPFLVNLLFFTFIFLITKILEITRMIVNYHVSIWAFLLLLLFSMPFFLAFITPMSVMMAVLLTFLRMSDDNETMALKACGLNPTRYLIPVLFFCLMGWSVTTLITLVALPWGNRSYYGLSIELAKTHVDAAIKERTFIDSFEGLTLYINNIDQRQQTLTDVFIEDQRNKGHDNIIVAPQGRILTFPDQNVIRLRLLNGAINQVDLAKQTAYAIAFETYEMNLDLKDILTRDVGKRKPIEEMDVAELKTFIQSLKKGSKAYYKALMQYHEKFALPVACFALGLLAIPLGMQAKQGKRTTGIVMGIFLFLMYYIMLSVGLSLGESGTLPPVIGMWTPNIVMGSIGIIRYYRLLRQ